MPNVQRIEIVDRQVVSPPDRFLRLETLRVRNHYADGTASREYRCDLVLAPGIDAVAVILFYREGGRVFVGVTDCIRPPVYLRCQLPLVQPDARTYETVTEVVAGRFEPSDAGEGGVERRAAAEALEEAGFAVDPAQAIRLGGELLSSPGQTPEKVFFRAFEVNLADRRAAHGDGSPMETLRPMRFIDLREAIRLCVAGEIEDPKAEVGFRRLADHLRH
jgi:ADP-ribose pyrophosphatase